MRRPTLNRREFCAVLGAAAVVPRLRAAGLAVPESSVMHQRTLGRTATSLPVIGMGSSNTFDVGTSATDRAPLAEVLRALHEAGGRVVDTSPMYGRSETVLGDLIEQMRPRSPFWMATKVWTQGREAGARQIAASMQALHVNKLDLLQIHNLLD